MAAVDVTASDGSTAQGYYLVGAGGGVLTFGSAKFYGSATDMHLAAPMVGMATTPGGTGYWLVGRDGGVFSYGGASFAGSAPGQQPTEPMVAIAPE